MGGTWAGEASGRSREGAPLANRNSLDGRDGNNRFVVAGGRFQPYSVMVACLAIPADDRCSNAAFWEVCRLDRDPQLNPIVRCVNEILLRPEVCTEA